MLMSALTISCPTSSLPAVEAVLPAPIDDYPAYYCYLEGVEGELTGYVEMSFTVTTEGDVRNPIVVRTEVCIGLDRLIPGFEERALETLLEEYRYSSEHYASTRYDE